MRLNAWALIIILSSSVALAQKERHDRIIVVPAPAGVSIDGELREWDLSGSIECAFDEALRPKFAVRLSLMYDAQALYIGAQFVDDTPLLNHHDPAVEPERGWAGDCLQVRLCSDPKAPYPLRDSNDDSICHLTMWFFTDKQLPVLQIQYGMDYHGTRVWTGTEAGLAFAKAADGQSYTLEARIPWDRLNAQANPPKANDRLGLVAQPLWSDGTGWKQVLTFNDVIRHAGFSFQGSGMWGQAIFSPRGNLPPAERVRPVEEALEPLTIDLPMPDPRARSLSAAIYDQNGQLVRTLPVLTAAADGGVLSPSMRWDGLDDEGRPLPAGRYTVKTLSHQGIGQKWVASLHNAGNPPWRTDDGTGSWGGDHGPPVAAASDAERVYLGWTISEAGWAIIALKKEFTPDGKVQKLWGQHQVHDLGILVTAIATDGERVFVAQDGRMWGDKESTSRTAGVVLWDPTTGKPVNFPFGKRVLPVSQWDAKQFETDGKRPWERHQSRDFGPQNMSCNLMGLAVSGDTLYASLRLENKVIAYNWRSGQKLTELSLPKPAGLAIDRQGSVVAVSDKQIVRLDAQSGRANSIVAQGLSCPWAVAVDAAGRIYVTDCGAAMQVKVFDAQGKPVRTIGKAGGRAWIGQYDPSGMLMPAGITVDRDGKVWVTEHDSTPKRVSVWSGDGKLLADLLGPGAYAVEGIADEQNPRRINVHLSLFEVDYNTGQTKTLATLIRPQMRGLQFTPSGGAMGRALRFCHAQGRTYLVFPGHHAPIIYLLKDNLVAEPVAALGWAKDLQIFGIDESDLPEDTRKFWKNRYRVGFRWTDENTNGLLEPPELVLEEVPRSWGFYWGSWLDDDLTIWSATNSTGAVWRVPVEKWLPGGVPLYPKPSEQQPIFEIPGQPQVHHVIPGKDCVYVLEQHGGRGRGQGAEWQAISRFTLDGKRLWAYRRTWLGFGLEAPLSKPGDVVGAMKFIGKARLDNGLELVAVNGYFGQFNVLSEDGLWVTSLCKDNRYGPPADEITVWPENFSGHFYRNPENGKVYLIAGDTDARIWEVTGLETIRTAQAQVSLTEADHQRAVEAAMRRQGVSAEAPPIRLRRMTGPAIDGDLGDWDMTATVEIDAGAGRGAKVALGYNDANLFAAFDVQDDSPMKNSGQDFALLFKTGDSCNVMLAANPSADPKRTRPAPGDLRLLFSVMDDKPVCVLYEPAIAQGERQPRMLSSPVSAELFDRVMTLDAAQVAVRRSQAGYVLEAAVPLSALGFVPKAGAMIRADVGVIFSDPGGSRNVLRAYYANKDTAIVNDIPSEARLEPHKWGMAQIE